MKPLLFTALSALTGILFAEPELTLSPGRPDSLYRQGETIVFRGKLTDAGTPMSGQNIQYLLEQENKVAPQKGVLVSDRNGMAELRLQAGKPGFVRATFTVLDAQRKPLVKIDKKTGRKKTFSVRIGAGVDPDKIAFSVPEPADFDAFWTRAKKELAAVPMKELERVAVSLRKPSIRAYDVKVSCAGPRPVSGILTIPADAKPKSCPAILTLHGAGVRSARANIHRTIGNHAIVLDLNAHGILNSQPAAYYAGFQKGELKDYIYFPATQPRETNYFKYMFLRALRALEYLRAQPEWDGKNLITMGGSQGGAQSLAVAGLDPKVNFCAATVPWLTAVNSELEGRFHPVWPTLLRFDRNGKLLNPQSVETLKYFDNAYLAKRIRAECAVGYGMIDHICGPSGVLIAYNNIPGKKRIFGSPGKGHDAGIPGDAVRDFLMKK